MIGKLRGDESASNSGVRRRETGIFDPGSDPWQADCAGERGNGPFCRICAAFWIDDLDFIQ